MERSRREGTARLARRAIAVVFAVLAAAVPFGVPTGAAPAIERYRPMVGVNSHLGWSSYTASERIAVLDRLAAAGVEWIRIDVGWASFEEHGPGVESQWYVEHVTAIADAARARGLRVLAVFASTPPWANGGAGGNVPPGDVEQYADALARLAVRLGDRISAWEVWNEPNQQEFWMGTAAQYAGLLEAAHAALTSVRPSAIVVMGGTAYNDTAWLESVYAAGARGSFDVVATHPYLAPADAPPESADTGSIWTIAHVSAVRALMVRFGDANLPIWFTEFGWSSHATPGMPEWARGVTPEIQADHLRRTLELVRTTYPYVTNVFWYNDRDRVDADPHNNNFGLLTSDLVPKPAYRALTDYLDSHLAAPVSSGQGKAVSPART